MELGRIDRNFPQQRVPYSEKQKAEWYANSIDYIIDMGLSCNDRNDTERKLDILHGNIPNEFYKKTLNPYNSNNEKYTRFPATMRNLDIMSDIIRRYVSEYFKGIHEFIVSASNPEIVIKKSAKLREEIGVMASQAFKQEFERRLQQMQAEAAQQGVPPEQINPQEAMPNPKEFMQNFNEKYIDDESKQGQDVLNFVRSITSDAMIYLSAFFDYVSLGECYTYSDIRGEKIVKEHIPVIDAFPIPNGEFFVEDHDMFARRHLMSYTQILDMFDDVLTKEDRAYLEKYYDYSSASGPTQLMYSKFFEYYPDVCEKFTKKMQSETFSEFLSNFSDDNSNTETDNSLFVTNNQTSSFINENSNNNNQNYHHRKRAKNDSTETLLIKIYFLIFLVLVYAINLLFCLIYISKITNLKEFTIFYQNQEVNHIPNFTTCFPYFFSKSSMTRDILSSSRCSVSNRDCCMAFPNTRFRNVIPTERYKVLDL